MTSSEIRTHNKKHLTSLLRIKKAHEDIHLPELDSEIRLALAVMEPEEVYFIEEIMQIKLL
ncbi:MAG: hypothetical protein FWG64_05385 [Firmicutes bacterium]|nr:hypothetical protein [Bacillota bacterium]